MTELYDFTEWSEDRLDRRYDALTEAESVPHNEIRKAAIAREISHLLFEVSSRYAEQNPGTVLLEAV